MDRSSRIAWWSIPLVAAVGIALVGIWVRGTLESSIRRTLEDQLRTVRDANVQALRIWEAGQKAGLASMAEQPDFVEAVEALVALERQGGASAVALRRAPELERLRRRMDPYMAEFGHVGWVVISTSGLNLAGARHDGIGKSLFGDQPRIRRLLQGEQVLATPFYLPPEASRGAGIHAEDVILFVGAPIRNAAGEVIAGLASRIPPESFTAILGTTQMGTSGEAYAFDADGLMLSLSRFNEELRAIGLLPDDPLAEAMLHVEIRNPGGNLLAGFQPKVPRKAQPLTRMAADAVAGGTGVDVEGYPDYRGVPVVGAWTWLPELEMGVAIEVDVAEAYASLLTLRRGFWLLFGLLAASGIGILVYTQVVLRLRRKVEKVEQLGQYHLLRKIGEGGMGKVYLAKHALLRRPTAIKLIRSADPGQIARFEREVQYTSRLCHPNTIAIYDYGRTPEGVFYYAMEYLDGITLGRLVDEIGPLPEGRAIHVLRQVCGSLAEAHAADLVHRDIKPANVILSQRGGQYDFVKVLDFGLVRSVHQGAEAGLTRADSFVGTPHYISPEAVVAPDSLDHRSDLYAVGALGYFLLTGRPVFMGGAYEVVGMHVNSPPEPPSKVLGRPISPDLEAVILRCLEKKREQRPAGAAELAEALGACPSASAWGAAEARSWWQARPQATRGTEPASGSISQPTLFQVDLDRRGGSGTPGPA